MCQDRIYTNIKKIEIMFQRVSQFNIVKKEYNWNFELQPRGFSDFKIPSQLLLELLLLPEPTGAQFFRLMRMYIERFVQKTVPKLWHGLPIFEIRSVYNRKR